MIIPKYVIYIIGGDADDGEVSLTKKIIYALRRKSCVCT